MKLRVYRIFDPFGSRKNSWLLATLNELHGILSPFSEKPSVTSSHGAFLPMLVEAGVELQADQTLF